MSTLTTEQPETSPSVDTDCSSAFALEALINERERARAAIRFTLASDDYNFDLVEAIESLVATLDDEEAGHADTLRLLKLREAEIARLVAVVNDGMKLFKEADEERLKETHAAQAEAERWKADDDMYGWNFHMGMGSGMTHASIFFYRVWRHLKKAIEPAN